MKIFKRLPGNEDHGRQQQFFEFWITEIVSCRESGFWPKYGSWPINKTGKTKMIFLIIAASDDTYLSHSVNKGSNWKRTKLTFRSLNFGNNCNSKSWNVPKNVPESVQKLSRSNFERPSKREAAACNHTFWREMKKQITKWVVDEFRTDQTKK